MGKLRDFKKGDRIVYSGAANLVVHKDGCPYVAGPGHLGVITRRSGGDGVALVLFDGFHPSSEIWISSLDLEPATIIQEIGALDRQLPQEE